ncbi:hypothetical protein WN51_02983 [Melipona quadrifasciata]|uniref:Uncharacterized protein n=1 Tax=Melipona quadrifasciata TaxID=166423 RepID=A0A0N0BEG3_9HYME|nr:hypothetical protein WN51_02983 [Melipona quadrifasciata]
MSSEQVVYKFDQESVAVALMSVLAETDAPYQTPPARIPPHRRTLCILGPPIPPTILANIITPKFQSHLPGVVRAKHSVITEGEIACEAKETLLLAGLLPVFTLEHGLRLRCVHVLASVRGSQHPGRHPSKAIDATRKESLTVDNDELKMEEKDDLGRGGGGWGRGRYYLGKLCQSYLRLKTEAGGWSPGDDNGDVKRPFEEAEGTPITDPGRTPATTDLETNQTEVEEEKEKEAKGEAGDGRKSKSRMRREAREWKENGKIKLPPPPEWGRRLSQRGDRDLRRRSEFLDYHEVTLDKFGSLLLCRLCEPHCFEPVSYRVCCSSERSKDIGSIWRLGIVRWMYSKPKGTNLIFGPTVQYYRGDNITTLAKQQPNPGLYRASVHLITSGRSCTDNIIASYSAYE